MEEERNDQITEDHVVATKEDTSVIVTAGAHDLPVIPVAVEWEGAVPACMESNGIVTPAQAEQTGDGRILLWLLAEVSAGESRVYIPSQQTDCALSTFQWEKHGTERTLLRIDGIPSIEYMHPVFDSNRVEETMKPFHHVYAPDGSRLITNGPGGVMSHHRGIFHGYQNIEFRDRALSTWGGRSRSHEHARFVQEWSGPVFGGHEVVIEWKDGDDVFVDEVRKVRVYRRPSGEVLIDMESVLTSRVGPVSLGGDPHHAGLQFRAAQYAYDHSEYSRYLRPDKWSEYPEDEEFNDTELYVNSPWLAYRFVVEGEPYTVGYLIHPQNASGGQISERLYGRFGEFVPGLVIEEGKPVSLRYRFLISSGHGIDRERMYLEYSAVQSAIH